MNVNCFRLSEKLHFSYCSLNFKICKISVLMWPVSSLDYMSFSCIEQMLCLNENELFYYLKFVTFKYGPTLTKPLNLEQQLVQCLLCWINNCRGIGNCWLDIQEHQFGLGGLTVNIWLKMLKSTSKPKNKTNRQYVPVIFFRVRQTIVGCFFLWCLLMKSFRQACLSKYICFVISDNHGVPLVCSSIKDHSCVCDLSVPSASFTITGSTCQL